MHERKFITIRNGYKYAKCQQCELWWNVRRGKDVCNWRNQQSDIGTASSEQTLAAAEK